MDDIRAPHDITGRQREVARLIALGHPNKQIARLLNVTLKTAEKHRYELMRHHGLHNAADITRFALKYSIILWGDL